ncbi:hypothetical protein V1508DRAFT_422388 [Lipomyces doorenjongii]|uniref:uncharacterized protein n=1 Tax=Lipomyces doorenjongii TaxID=383834 RepID=UPI0034CDA6AF
MSADVICNRHGQLWRHPTGRRAKDRFLGIQGEERRYAGGQVRFSVPIQDGMSIVNASDIFKILELDKEKLGTRYYSISQPSLEQVHDVVEEGY